MPVRSVGLALILVCVVEAVASGTPVYYSGTGHYYEVATPSVPSSPVAVHVNVTVLEVGLLAARS